MMKNKVKFASLGAVIVILFLTGMTAAQTPTCSNRHMEISSGVVTPGPLLTRGKYKIWAGKKIPPKGFANWRSFGPFQLAAGTKYLAIITNGKMTGLLANDVSLNSYGNPGTSMAAIYYLSKTQDGAWYAVCTQLIKP
jgi:hypothetical protein